MANKRNPNSNSIRQALLDLADLGYEEMTIRGAITKIGADAKLAADLQNKWNSHAYPEKAITWTQLTKDQHILTLSSDALKVLVTMGMYCHQNGLVQVRRQDLVVMTGVKMSSLKEALKELLACGAVSVYKESVRHEAPIYGVNPALFAKGKRSKQAQESFVSHLGVKPEDYIFRRKLDMVVIADTVCRNGGDGDDIITYNRLSLTKDPAPAPNEKAPSDGDASKEGKLKTITPPQHNSTADAGQAEPEPHQMHITEFADALPELDWMEATNHGTDT